MIAKAAAERSGLFLLLEKVADFTRNIVAK